jgi:hypothetical protein
VASSQVLTTTVTVKRSDGSPATGTARLCVQRISATVSTCFTHPLGVDGTAAFRFGLLYSSMMAGTYLGDGGAPGSTSKHVQVAVAPVLTLTGGTGRLTVRSSPAPRAPAHVERRGGSTWSQVTTVTLPADQTATTVPVGAGTYRVRTDANPDQAAAISATATVR